MLENTLGVIETRQRATVVRYAIASRQPWRTLNLERERCLRALRTMTTERSGGFLESRSGGVQYGTVLRERINDSP